MKKQIFNPNQRNELTKGLIAAWPICLGFIPVGLAFGVLAQKVGLSPLEIGMMSLLVFAGSSQFIAISMLGSNTAYTTIIMTTFIVNLRHLLMSSALTVHLGKARRSWLALFGYGITDESFAINLARFRDSEWTWQSALVVNHAANLCWIISTVIGGFGGQFIPENAFGIDYALIAMFICLLMYQLRGRKYLITAILSGTLAVILSLSFPGNSYIILASTISATLVMALRRTHRREAK